MASKIKKAIEQELSPGRDMACAYGQDEKIAELAYLKAERRGGMSGHELDDWLEAEQEVYFTRGNDIPVNTGNLGLQVGHKGRLDIEYGK